MADRGGHPFGWFAGEGDQASPEPGPGHPLMAALLDAERHERYAHLVTTEAILAALDGMSVEVGPEARAQIKARLVAAGWSEMAVDSLLVDPRWRMTLAGIEAAYAVAIEQARAEARGASKAAGHAA